MPRGGQGRPSDAGGYIGHEPELARDTIPGGVRRGDRRVSSVATQSTGARPGGRIPEEQRGWPEGHREGPPASEDAVRQAGENQ
jgi:hypothetical protein